MRKEEDSDMIQIREHFERLLEANCWRSKKGHFSSPKDAKTYSCSNKALRSGAIKNPDLIKRGKVTSKGSISSPFGMNSSKDKQCGRTRFPDGSKISPKYSCKDYNAKYEILDPEESEDTALIATKTDAVSPRRAISDQNRTTGNRKPSKSLKSPRRAIRVTVSRKPVIETLVQQGSKTKQKQVILSDVVDGILELIASTTDDELLETIHSEIGRLPQKQMSSDELVRRCRAKGFATAEEFLSLQNRMALSNKGELNQAPKEKK